jgi:hypothetical protein
MRIDLCGLSLFFLAPKTAAWTWVEGENELRTAIEKDGRALVACELLQHQVYVYLTR